MNPTELREAFERATAGEPPLRVDTDRVVAVGRSRARRRRALTTTGVAVLAAGALAVPVALWNGAGSGGQAAGNPGRSGPTIEPTPGDPHGGCREQTHSGSTQGHVFAEWFVRQLPDTYRYNTDPGWQNSYQTDCVDGATFDTVDVGARVIGQDGDLGLVTARNDPAEPVAEPCKPPDTTIIATKMSGPEPPGSTPTAGSGTPHPTATAGSAEPPTIYDRCETHSRPDGSTLTIEESHQTGPDAGQRSRAVTWWRVDGTTVRLDVDNRHVLDDSARNPNLVLTIDQMVALVTDPGVLPYLPPAR